MADKIYVGSCKEVESQYGSFLKLGFSKKHLEVLMENLNEKGFVNLNINERKITWEYGDTHTVTINNYVSPEKPVEKPVSKPKPVEQELSLEDIPF